MIKLLLLLTFSSNAQQDSLEFTTPRQLIEQAKSLEENGDYQQAVDLYLTISENDTSYVEAMSELMSAYNADEQYDKTILLGTRLKDVKSEFRNDIFISLGNAYLENGQLKESREIYTEGLELFPYSTVRLYNMGLSHYRDGHLDTAVSYFQRSAKINPYYSSNHVMLGYISMMQGHKAHSMLSYLTYLAINPDRNSILVFLENMVNNAIREEGKTKEFIDNNAFEYYDNLVRSGAALDSRFKRKVNFDVSIVKQAELVFSKLQYVNETDDFWMDFYVPFYTQLEANGLSEAFIYFILKSTGNEGVTNWIEGHPKEKGQWVDLANNLLKQNRIQMEAEILGEKNTYTFWYFSNNALSAIGNQIDEETRIGPWEFYSANGQLNARGKYNNSGEKIGDWVLYHDNGEISRTEKYDEKGSFMEPARYYHENGALSIVANYTNNELDGLLEYYYDCGELKEQFPYQNGAKTGNGKLYYASGQERAHYIMNDGNLDQDYIYFHKNGQKSTHYKYKEGVLDGPFVSYYIDGQINESGEYFEDSLSGDWIGYHPYGVKSYEGSMTPGKREGKWAFYHTNGKIKSYESYDSEGETHGDVTFFNEQGLLSEISNYDHGKLVGYTFFGLKGDTLSTKYSADGNMIFESYYQTGEPIITTALQDGKMNGPYISYYKNGNVNKKGTMLDDMFDGAYEEFYSTGQVKTKCSYSSGVLNGYFQTYYKNGQLEQEGYYINGEMEQLWTTYYPDGSKDQELYYITSETNGWSKNYAPGNKLYRAFKYDNGTMIGLQEYDTLGKVYHEVEMKYGTGVRAHLTVNGDTTFKSNLHCGYFDSNIRNQYPGGKTESEYELKNDLYEGKYTAYTKDGKIRTEGSYANDERHGTWTWYYENGQVESIYNYVRGELEDQVKHYYQNGRLETICDYSEGSQHGACKYYDQFGNLQLIKIYDKDDGFIAYINNQTKDTIQFVNKGEFSFSTYFDNGKLAVTQNFKEGKFNGNTSYYNHTGSLIESNEYSYGDNHGESIIHHPNGKVYLERVYNADLKHGAEKEYFETGKLKRVTNYLNGEKNGWEIIYNSSGSVKSKTFYRNDTIY